MTEQEEHERDHPGCTCPVGDWVACIGGTVFGPCDSDLCYGVCDFEGKCSCPKHVSTTHSSGYGGTYSD